MRVSSIIGDEANINQENWGFSFSSLRPAVAVRILDPRRFPSLQTLDLTKAEFAPLTRTDKQPRFENLRTNQTMGFLILYLGQLRPELLSKLQPCKLQVISC